MLSAGYRVHLGRPFQPKLVTHVLNDARLDVHFVGAWAWVRMGLSLVRLNKTWRPLIYLVGEFGAFVGSLLKGRLRWIVLSRTQVGRHRTVELLHGVLADRSALFRYPVNRVT